MQCDDDNGEKDYADRHDDAPAVRFLAMLEKKGLNEEQIESFVERAKRIYRYYR